MYITIRLTNNFRFLHGSSAFSMDKMSRCMQKLMHRTKFQCFTLFSRPLRSSCIALYTAAVSANTGSAAERQFVSYDHGAASQPLRYKTFSEVLDEQAEAFGDKLAFVSRHQRIRRTYADFHQDVHRLALGLLSIGCEPGDRVGIWAPSCYEWILTQFAAAKAGLILVNINPSYKPNELLIAVNKVGVRLLVLAGGFRRISYPDSLAALIPDLEKQNPTALKCSQMPTLRGLILIKSPDDADRQIPVGYLNFADILDAGNATTELSSKLDSISKRTNADMPVNIQFTSGTTGSPKGATLTHHNVLNNAYTAGRNMGFDREKPILCCSVPLYHCFGCVLGVLASFQHGGTLVLPNEYFDPEKVLEAVEAEKCDTIYGVPTMFSDILNHEARKSTNLISLRRGIMSGAPCPAPLLQKCIEVLHVKDMLVVYGTTETSPIVTMSAANADFETRLTQVGKVIDHVELKISDAAGNAMPRGEPGEVLVRGYMSMLGYWGEPEKTAEVIAADRWYKTGDVGIMRTDGYVSIVGRKKDMIIRGGENVYPAEIENSILKHELVCEAHVVGVSNERLGEEICVWLKLHALPSTREEVEKVAGQLRTHCRTEMAHYKVPRYFVMHDKEAMFPVTVTGKVQKHVMREQSDVILKSIDKHEHVVFMK